ncbi:hypothetical protein CI109_104831 [Kwoniella shandongensis]|uniref:Uncharacterized protein n=1 Tax=Kwoniella shandongensis TaxID=1734106 RepID=A0A5M6BVC4_9TREE|nr:uncharacterized protein CI109_006186 [Kwoniella shandongensis]KAA5525495.1 hypothetical protein CI109_006186 [Kwoniella shandongensis]
MSMLDRLRGRTSSTSAPTPTSSSAGAETTRAPTTGTTTPTNRPFRRESLPYEKPDPKGTCWLLALPDELLERVFTSLDRVSLTRCYRLCKRLTDLLSTNSSISLHHLLLTSSLTLNPYVTQPNPLNLLQIPPSRVSLLSTLRERLTRFRNFTPKSTTRVDFEESEGRLYEYLEGVLLRNVPPPGSNMWGGSRDTGREIAVYELNKVGEWEDVPVDAETQAQAQAQTQTQGEDIVTGDDDEGSVLDDDEPANDVRRTHTFGFEMQDFAVDPGQDLFVVAEARPTPTGTFSLHFHLLTLSTFAPHPRAAQTVLDWPHTFNRNRHASLGFQICDDGLFVLRNNVQSSRDQLCGWQWTTGRLAVTLRPAAVSTFESFVCLTPSSFIIPTVATRIRPDSTIQDDLANPNDLEFTLHLMLYAFPPFSAVPLREGAPVPPPHTAIHVTTIDLPRFKVDFDAEIPPPRMTVRTDPPPRYTPPTHPVGSPQAFIPDPESGVVVLEFYCQPLGHPNGRQPHYVLFTHKKTLLSYLPAPTSPLLFQAFPRPAPVVPFSMIAPKVRFIGPNEQTPSWVCYVYQDRYIAPQYKDPFDPATLRLYDFNLLRVRKELYDRRDINFEAEPSDTEEPTIRDEGILSDPLQRLLSATNLLSPSSNKNKTPTPRAPEHKYDGDRDGIVLVTEETVLPKLVPLDQEIRTGRDMPYLYVDKPLEDDVDAVVLDGERVVIFDSEGDEGTMEVMEF